MCYNFLEGFFLAHFIKTFKKFYLFIETNANRMVIYDDSRVAKGDKRRIKILKGNSALLNEGITYRAKRRKLFCPN